VRRVLVATLLLVAVLAGAGCGNDSNGSGSGDGTTQIGTSADANAIYERAYSECSSTDLEALAGKYQVAQPTVDNVARAVGASWADKYNAGEDGQAVGESACRDGIETRPDSPGSA
jgi:hypothetical protein